MVSARPIGSDLPPPADLAEHAPRLLDVLSLADAIPHRRRADAARSTSRCRGERPTLAERVVALDAALADVPHAFGGALALAYYAEPRATIDIDLNVFVPAERFEDVAAPLARPRRHRR